MSESNFEDELMELRAAEPVDAVPEAAPQVNSQRPAGTIAMAGAVTFLFSLAQWIGNVGSGLTFGPWQAAYLDATFPYRVPLLSLWTARAVASVPVGNVALRTILASTLCAALASALLTVVTTQILARKLSLRAAAICGVFAGILFTLTPAWSRVGTSASPAAVTMVLALVAMSFLQYAIDTTKPRWLAYCGLFAGLATANDPSFGIVFFIFILVALGEMGERVFALKLLAPLLLAFLLPALIPALYALGNEETLQGFLAHATSTAYPTIGDGMPRLGFGTLLITQFSWPTLGVAMLGLTALFPQGKRGSAVAWAALFLALGPFLPSLTNQHTSPYVLRDADAAGAMAYAAVCVGATWGVATLCQLLFNAGRSPQRHVAAICALGAVVLGLQFWHMPARDLSLPEKVARGIFSDCGNNAILVVGDPFTNSLLRTLQIARRERQDVSIISVHALEQREWREFLHRKYAASMLIPNQFPPEGAWERWPKERPNEFAVLNLQMGRGRVSGRDFSDLMLWEFMRDNFDRRPLYFAGVTTPWLTARGKQVGVMLQYPRVDGPEGHSLDKILTVDKHDITSVTDPDMSKTIVGLLLPVAEAMRRQDNTLGAEKIAAMAREYGSNDAGAWLASARAAARLGQRDRAIDYAAQYIRLAATEHDMQVFLDLIEEDLRRNALANAFAEINAHPSTPANQTGRAELASQLWELDEVAVLSNGYAAALRDGGTDFDLLYEDAAAQTQLGDLSAARESLGRAVKANYQEAWKRLQADGRFYILQVQSSASAKPRNS